VEAESGGAGKGAAFTVTLPLLVMDGQGAGAEEPHAHLPATARALRVLVVDDNKDAAETLAMLLETLGHEVQVVHDPLHALEAARGAPFDACILDIGLPGMSGYELAGRLRGSSGAKAATFIALTGYGSADDRQRGDEAGFDHDLVKPADANDLVRLLQPAAA
jgi:CheY-like chemotaxis protein